MEVISVSKRMSFDSAIAIFWFASDMRSCVEDKLCTVQVPKPITLANVVAATSFAKLRPPLAWFISACSTVIESLFEPDNHK